MPRYLPIVLVLAVFSLLPATAGAQSLPPSLSGVQFGGDPSLTNLIFDDYDFDASTALTGCDPAGTSEMRFTESGISTGAYPGTYTETVELTLGPQAAGGGSTPGVLQGTVTTLTASFTISSPAGTVTGTKTLAAPLGWISNVGSCYTAEEPTGADWSRPSLLDYLHDHRALLASATYEATIVTSEGTFTDSGGAWLRFDEGGFVGTCAPSSWCPPGSQVANWFYSNHGFQQSFFDSAGVQPVVTNESPSCSAASATPSMLWPPSHDLQMINIGGVSDPDGDTVSVTVDAISQDEAVREPGSGGTSPDGGGLGGGEPFVRAERSGKGNGRVYHIAFSADDGQGGTCSGVVQVGVPKSQGRGGAPVDDGASYDSTSD